MWRSELLKWGIKELLRKFPELRLQPTKSNETIIAGTLAFSAEAQGQRQLSDRYEICISVPAGFPKAIPLVRETGMRIPRDFHKLDSGHLCLGSPTRLRLILADNRTLLSFVERCVIPYLYGYSIVESGGELPFGELSHGARGLREDLASMLGITDESVLLGFVRLLSMKKREANKRPCPCSSGMRVGRCHNMKLNTLRTKLGRGWF